MHYATSLGVARRPVWLHGKSKTYSADLIFFHRFAKLNKYIIEDEWIADDKQHVCCRLRKKDNKKLECQQLECLKMPNLISDTYLQLNQQLHTDRNDYGTGGWRWVSYIQKLVKEYNTTDVLDYGCGKSTLQKNLSFEIAQYDPAIENFSQRPEEKHDIVTCTDVLEHIEPEYIDEVLADIRNLTSHVAFLNIALRPACKTLADGRNAHLIVETEEWWLQKINLNFTINRKIGNKRELILIVTPIK